MLHHGFWILSLIIANDAGDEEEHLVADMLQRKWSFTFRTLRR